MTDPKPFLPSEAKDALPDAGDFLLPICLPRPGLLMGEALAVVVFTTIEGQRVGLPLGMEALSDLYETLGEALRMMQAGEGDAVQ